MYKHVLASVYNCICLLVQTCVITRAVYFVSDLYCMCACGHLVVKMPHLWAADCQNASSFGRRPVCVCVCVCVCMWLSGCQDATSLDNRLSRCLIFRQKTRVCVCVFGCMCACGRLVVKMPHLWATDCQDASSFGRRPCVCVCVCTHVVIWM